MKLEEWIMIIQGHIVSAWEKRKNAKTPEEQKYWNNVIRNLKNDIAYSLYIRGYELIPGSTIADVIRMLREEDRK